MKQTINILLISIIIFLSVLFLISCEKEVQKKDLPPGSGSIQPIIPGTYEIKWGLVWERDSIDYKIIIPNMAITNDVINRGIDVYVAPWTGWSSFYKLPFSIAQPDYTDTVHFSYVIEPGKIKLKAITIEDLSRAISDVKIEYR